MSRKHVRGKSLQEHHPSGSRGGNKHREPHPSGKGADVHVHRMHSGGGKVTGKNPKEY